MGQGHGLSADPLPKDGGTKNRAMSLEKKIFNMLDFTIKTGKAIKQPLP